MIIFIFYFVRLCYGGAMKKSSLLVTNIYLRDQTTRDKLLRQSVISSSAIEGVGTAAARALADIERKPKVLLTPSVAAKSV